MNSKFRDEVLDRVEDVATLPHVSRRQHKPCAENAVFPAVAPVAIALIGNVPLSRSQPPVQMRPAGTFDRGVPLNSSGVNLSFPAHHGSHRQFLPQELGRVAKLIDFS